MSDEGADLPARGGDDPLAPAVTRGLVERSTARRPAGAGNAAALRELTAREVQVLRLAASGSSNAEIAAQL